MQQVVSVFLIGSILVGVFVGQRVEKARSSRGYYRRVKSQVPEMRKSSWIDVRNAAGAVLVVLLFGMIVWVAWPN